MTQIIYTHRKGELAAARRRRMRDPIHRQIQRMNQIARQRAEADRSVPTQPQLRKKGTPPS
jgi:hypothetical protein